MSARRIVRRRAWRTAHPAVFRSPTAIAHAPKRSRVAWWVWARGPSHLELIDNINARVRNGIADAEELAVFDAGAAKVRQRVVATIARDARRFQRAGAA